MTPLNTSVLLIYTGGTIGMIENTATGALENFNFEQLQRHIPELQKFNFPIDTYQFDPPMDSSDMEPDMWRMSMTRKAGWSAKHCQMGLPRDLSTMIGIAGIRSCSGIAAGKKFTNTMTSCWSQGSLTAMGPVFPMSILIRIIG